MRTEPSSVIPLADGGRLVLSDEQVARFDHAGTAPLVIRWGEITNVRRGGRDLVITRREADPVIIVATTVADAARCIEEFGQHASQPPPTRWWTRQRRSTGARSRRDP